MLILQIHYSPLTPVKILNIVPFFGGEGGRTLEMSVEFQEWLFISDKSHHRKFIQFV